MSSFMVCAIRNQMEDVMGAKCGAREEINAQSFALGEGT